MSDGAKLMVAALLAWAGCLAGLVATDAIQPRHVLMAPSVALLVLSLPAAFAYMLLSRWIGTSWLRIFAPLFLLTVLMAVSTEKVIWHGAPPTTWWTALRWCLGASIGAATGFWAGLRLARFQPA